MESFSKDEPASSVQLTRLPASLENVDRKLNHLLTRTEVAIEASERAEKAARVAGELAQAAKKAAQGAGTQAVRALHAADRMTPWQRFVAVAAGAFGGGAAVSAVVKVLAVIAGGIGVASCLKSL